MARKSDLRLQRAGTIINWTSKLQESAVGEALKVVIANIEDSFGVKLRHDSEWRLRDIVGRLRDDFPEVTFAQPFDRSSMRPDGGILSVVETTGAPHPILIVEVKNQGTNDLRAAEGKAKQAKGNAIERLGKNVIGFRAAMLTEGIIPFVCFGYGCDFADNSSILDRVVTVAMFGPLNQINVVPEGDAGLFNRGSYFFREAQWSVEEMSDRLLEVATRSIDYYFAKYGRARFGISS
ncbi:MAG: EcoRI family type II restriction endonuclease [Acidimicrobiales bacterium]